MRFRQAAKISASSSENIGKYEFLTGEYILLEKNCYQKKLLPLKDLNTT